MKMKKITTPNSEHGFSLMEVMVALVIFSIGLIGLAGLQSASLGYNHSAYMRSQATYLAYNILDKMRANPAKAKNGNYAALAASYGYAGVQHSCYYSTSASCSDQQIVETDLYEWNQALQKLPGGKGKIAKTSTLGAEIHEVTIQWDDPISNTNTTTIIVRSES